MLVALLAPASAWAVGSFSDVPEGRFYTDAVEWALANGITTGTSASTFEPDRPVTRAELVTFLKRYDDGVAAGRALEALGCDIGQAAMVDGNGWGCVELPGPVSDTLASLQCSAGQVPTLVGGRWACRTPVDTDTDTLGELACTANEVAVRKGAGWVCRTPVLTYDVDWITTATRTLDSTGSVGAYTAVAIGPNGRPVISYFDSTNGDLELYVCDNATCSSGTASTLDSTGSVGSYTSITIGDDGTPVISYYDLTNSDLKVYVCDNATCSSGTASTLDSTGSVGSYTSIEVGDEGALPVIAYQNAADGDLRLAVAGTRATGIVYE